MIKQDTVNVGIYTRLSHDDERAGDSVSIENQKAMLSHHVKEQNWNLVDSYADDGYTGTNFERPAFIQMIQDAKAGKINTILCKDLSRFGRDYIEVGKYTDYIFPTIGCRFIALNDGVDTITKNNDMLMIFKNVMNDFYARDTSDKIKAVRQNAYRQGKFIGCYAPYGYQKNPENKHHLIIDEKVVPTVKLIFSLRLKGYGFRKIASHLNELKIQSPRDYYYDTIGKPNPQRQNHLWNDVTIRKLLRNEVYIGNMVQNKTGHPSYKSKKMIQKPKEDWIRVDNTHEPIIDTETWERSVEIDQKNTKTRSTKTGELSLFSGLMYCLDCGFAMRLQQETHKRKNGSVVKYQSYLCGNYMRSGKSACAIHTIYMKPLTEVVLTDIQQKAKYAKLNQDKMLEKLLQIQGNADKNQIDSLKKELHQAKNRLSELDRLIPALYEDKVKGDIPESVCTELMGKYEAERKELSPKIAELTEKTYSFKAETEQAQSWVDLIQNYSEITELDRDIVNLLIEKIEVGEREIIGNQKQRIIKIHYRFVGYIG